LRLIENSALANQILEYYDRWVIAATTYSEYLTGHINEVNKSAINFFNWRYLEKLVKTDTVFSYAADSSLDHYIAGIRERKPQLTLLNKNPDDLSKLNNEVSQLETALHAFNSFLRLDKKFADSLIRQIGKEYDLKEE
jgi:hypothetical protein